MNFFSTFRTRLDISSVSDPGSCENLTHYHYLTRNLNRNPLEMKDRLRVT